MAKLKLTAGREKKPAEDVPMIFSVFYGKPAQASSSLPKPLKNVLFDVKVNGEFLETARQGAEEPRGRLWERLMQQHVETDTGMAQFREIIHLATTHNEKILELWGDKKCVFCNVRPAGAVVYQPLCCTYDGYYALADGDRLIALMLSLSKLVSGLDSHAKVRTAVGSSADVPYINGLAVPICSPDAQCQKAANVGIGSLTRTLGKGLFDEKEFWVGDSEGEMDGNSNSKNVKKGDEWEEDDDDHRIGDRHTKISTQERIPLRYTAIIGQPIIDRTSEPRLMSGRLTCLVFTSRWEADLLSDAAIKNSCKSFQKIASFHERFIMQAARFRCAVCPTPVPASTLVHRPISFKREADTSSSSDPVRQTMLKLLQYIGGQWKYPETKAALGYGGIHNINGFIVPICRRNSTCGEAARRAANQFIDQQLPAGAQTIYPRLALDTDLSGKWLVGNAGKKPKLIVKKVNRGVMSDTTDTDKAKADAIKANNKAIANICRGIA